MVARPSGHDFDTTIVEAQVALLERTVDWLAERSGIVTPAHAHRIGQAVERTAAILRAQVDRSDNRPDRSVGDWVLFDGRPHLVREIHRNPWTCDVLNVRLTSESGKTGDAPLGRGLEKIR